MFTALLLSILFLQLIISVDNTKASDIALNEASKNGHIEVIKHFIEEGANINH